MDIQHSDLERAASKQLIAEDKVDSLWAFFQEQSGESSLPRFDFAHVLYYLGGFLGISAVTLFVDSSWDSLLGWPLLVVSFCFFVLGCIGMNYFLQQRLMIPAGIVSVFTLAMTPLATYNVLLLMHWQFNPSWHYFALFGGGNHDSLFMEVVTIVVGSLMLYRHQFPFLVFPLSLFLWFLSIDLAGLFDFLTAGYISVAFGIGILMMALYIDYCHQRLNQDYAYWLYLFGLLTFSGGMYTVCSSEVSMFFNGLLNVAFLFFGVLIQRRIFLVFGAIGIMSYLIHLSCKVFFNNPLFPLMLVCIGFCIMLVAKHWPRFEVWLRKRVLNV